MMAQTVLRQGTWVPVCRLVQLRVDVGVAALVDGAQVALFRLDDTQIRAIGNQDPYSRANVMSRGIVGSRGDALFVASPMYKQPFDLSTGQCLDDPAVSVPTFEVRVVEGVVQVMAAAGTGAPGSAPGSAAPGTVSSDKVSSGRAASGRAASGRAAPDG